MSSQNLLVLEGAPRRPLTYNDKHPSQSNPTLFALQRLEAHQYDYKNTRTTSEKLRRTKQN